MMRVGVATLAAVMVLVTGAGAVTTTTTTPTPKANPLTCAKVVVATWSTRQLANATIVVSVNAMDLAAMAPASRAGYGGLLLYGTAGPVRMASIVARLQALRPHGDPILVMTDEEGGGVQRLTNVVGSIPWAQTMGKNLTASQIRATGARIGGALLAAGVNVDLAPVLDVDGASVLPGARDPDGLRSFGGSSALVAADGTAFMAGLVQAGVTAVVKHFPGLGGASGNTDDGPATTKPWSVLRSGGLVPFEAAIGRGATAVMLTNASVPGFTSLPASLSPVVIDELRQRLDFHGLIISDSLTRGAIGALGLSEPAAALRALQAGDDLTLYGSPSSSSSSLALAQRISNALVGAVLHGTLTRSRLLDAAAHVLATRETGACVVPAS